MTFQTPNLFSAPTFQSNGRKNSRYERVGFYAVLPITILQINKIYFLLVGKHGKLWALTYHQFQISSFRDRGGVPLERNMRSSSTRDKIFKCVFCCQARTPNPPRRFNNPLRKGVLMHSTQADTDTAGLILSKSPELILMGNFTVAGAVKGTIDDEICISRSWGGLVFYAPPINSGRGLCIKLKATRCSSHRRECICLNLQVRVHNRVGLTTRPARAFLFEQRNYATLQYPNQSECLLEEVQGSAGSN